MSPEHRTRMMDLLDAIRTLEDRLDKLRLELRQLVLEDEEVDHGVDEASALGSVLPR